MKTQKSKMKKIGVLFFSVILSSCFSNKEAEPKVFEWRYARSLILDGVNPIGLTEYQGELWLSDGDHNRVVQIDSEGQIVKTIDSLDRPMHLTAWNNALYVPQYGNDQIAVVSGEQKQLLKLTDSIDAPAGIAVANNRVAIADFYNNRILYKEDSEWIAFGKSGKAKGYFYYPTDVQLTDSLIWVADAYNHRVQVFNNKGDFIKMIGQDQKMNAATGILVNENSLFVTDFENGRVLIFNLDGDLRQTLEQGIKKPTDVLIYKEELHILNYRAGEVVVYTLQEKKQ